MGSETALRLAHDKARCPWCLRGRRMPSGSRLDRVQVCAPAAVLPQVSHRSSKRSTRGRALHRYFADVSIIGAKKALAAVPEEWRDDAALIDLSVLPIDAAKFAPEVALAYNVDTGEARVLGQNIERNYDELPELNVCAREICGTPDVLGLTDDAVIIPDYKTGKAWFDPEKMWQLLIYALAACRAFKKVRAISGVIRLRDDGSSYWQKVEFSSQRLAEFEAELKRVVARIDAAGAQLDAGRLVSTVESEFCKNCPAFDYCPSKLTLVRQFAAAPESIEIEVAQATPEQLALAWDRVHALNTVIERVDKALRERASAEPFTLPDGRIVGPLPVDDETKTEVASMVLEALHGEEVAKAALKTTVSTSKTQIEAALRDHVYVPRKKPTLKDLKEAVFNAIRAAGGFVVKEQIRAHQPKALKE